MHYVRKIRLQVDEETRSILDEQSRILTWLYNHLLERANELRRMFRETQDLEIGRILYTEHGLRDLIPEMRKQYPDLNKVYSNPLRNAAVRLSRAVRDYQASQHGKRSGPKIRWPNFRSYGAQWFSLDYDETWKGYRLNGRKLSICLGKGHGAKRVIHGKLVEPLPLKHGEQVLSMRIARHAGQFFAIFTIQRETPGPKETTPLRVIARPQSQESRVRSGPSRTGYRNREPTET